MRGFSHEIESLTVFQQRQVPGFPQPRAVGDDGRLLFGRVAGVPTAVVEGRLHLYEGALPGECSLGVRLLAAVGASRVVLVADGLPLREGLERGTVLLVSDRLDLTGVANLKGVVDAEGGPLIEVPAADPALLECAREAGRVAGVPLAEGVAALVHGPLLPSPAERRMQRLLGADACTAALGPELAAVAYTGISAAAFLVLGGGWDRAHLEFLLRFLAGWERRAGAPAAGQA